MPIDKSELDRSALASLSLEALSDVNSASHWSLIGSGDCGNRPGCLDSRIVLAISEFVYICIKELTVEGLMTVRGMVFAGIVVTRPAAAPVADGLELLLSIVCAGK